MREHVTEVAQGYLGTINNLYDADQDYLADQTDSELIDTIKEMHDINSHEYGMFMRHMSNSIALACFAMLALRRDTRAYILANIK